MAVLAAGLLVSTGVGPSFAADLGGSCCADLEERIAELEATTARKGNRKVSLEIYGQVNQEVLWWDDGGESNAMVYTNDNSRTRIGFRGKAKINADWEAGYRLELGIRTANSKRFNQNNPTGNANPEDVGFDLRDSYWFLRNKKLGTVSLGQQASATDQITEINQTQTKDFSKYSDVEDTGFGLLVRSAINGQLAPNTINPVGHPTSSPGDSGITLRRLIGDGGDQPGEGERRYNLVKYESPEIAGFTASAAWGEDDFWDVALRYAGKFAGVSIAAGVGYGRLTDGAYLNTKTVCAGRSDAPSAAEPSTDQQCDQFGGSISLVHETSGLFLNAGAGVKNDDLLRKQARFSGVNGVDESQDFWSIQAGIEKKFIDYGKTTIYGEYYDYNGGATQRRTVNAGTSLDVFNNGLNSAIWSTGVQVYGAGIAQGFDKAALVLYLSYRHVEPELTLREIGAFAAGKADGEIADSPLEDVDLVTAGGIIKF